VKDFLLDNLQKLDAGARFGAKFRGHSIPSLAELFDFLLNTAFQGIVNIEVKRDASYCPSLLPLLVDFLNSRSWPFRCLYSSFDLNLLKELSLLDPARERAHLSSHFHDFQLGLSSPFVDSLHPRKQLIFDRAFSNITSYSKPLRLWTLNTEAEMRIAFKLGLSGFMTDNPLQAMKIKALWENKKSF
jgi:glycerophosphoryl diester phosphodiesterase